MLGPILGSMAVPARIALTTRLMPKMLLGASVLVVKDGTHGGELVVLSLSLLVFAIHVPTLIGFTVARYEPLRSPAAP